MVDFLIYSIGILATIFAVSEYSSSNNKGFKIKKNRRYIHLVNDGINNRTWIMGYLWNS